jgi:hypothetical protein
MAEPTDVNAATLSSVIIAFLRQSLDLRTEEGFPLGS